MPRGAVRKFNNKEKYCKKCDTWVPLDLFYKAKIKKHRMSGRGPYCKPCTKIYSSIWHAKNWSTYGRKRQIEKKYGLSMKEYNSLVASHKGRCGICKDTKKLYIDHCHKTGKVRGLLCCKCNLNLGYTEKYYKSINKYLQNV